MSIDLKNDLLKSFLSDQKLGKKAVSTTIDQSMISSAGQKSLGDLQNESLENNESKKFKAKEKKDKELKLKKALEDEKIKKEAVKIERDPLKLLYFF